MPYLLQYINIKDIINLNNLLLFLFKICLGVSMIFVGDLGQLPPVSDKLAYDRKR